MPIAPVISGSTEGIGRQDVKRIIPDRFRHLWEYGGARPSRAVGSDSFYDARLVKGFVGDGLSWYPDPNAAGRDSRGAGQ